MHKNKFPTQRPSESGATAPEEIQWEVRDALSRATHLATRGAEMLVYASGAIVHGAGKATQAFVKGMLGQDL